MTLLLVGMRWILENRDLVRRKKVTSTTKNASEIEKVAELLSKSAF